MVSEKVTTEYKKNITRGAIEIVEKKYISSSANISNVIIEYLHYDYGLVSQCFKEVTGLSLAKYAKRRKYTELYCKHKKEFDGYKYDATVDGVRCFKKKVWQEFGNPISELQNKIDVDDSEDFICDKEMERGCKKEIRKIKKNREPIYSDGELLLMQNGETILRDWSKLYIETKENVYLLEGQVVESLQVIGKLRTERSVISNLLPRICLEGFGKDGSWLVSQLVQRVCCADVGEIIMADLSRDFLRWEENDLYLCIK